MDTNQLTEAAQAAFKSREVAAPVVGVGTSIAAMAKSNILLQAETILTVVVLALSAIWLLVQMWSRIKLTRHATANPPKKEGIEA